MLGTLLSWGIILLIAVVLGRTLYTIFCVNTFRFTSKYDLYIVLGLMAANVYAQFFSIFSGVGKTAFFALLLITVFAGIYLFISEKNKGIKVEASLRTWQLCVGIVIILLLGLWTMRSPQHVDTYLYHAQAIHWVEEYGLVPGLGNFHNRFAYNSAFIPLQALFSFSWIYEPSMHSLNGFSGCVFSLYAILSNKLLTRARVGLSDYLKISKR